MVWNQPGNNGNDRDPLGFGGKSSKGNQKPNDPSQSEPNQSEPGNKEPNSKEPQGWNSPSSNDKKKSVEDIFGQFLGGKKQSGGGSGSGRSSPGLPPNLFKKLIPVIGGGLIAIWAVSGFYTVREAERAVITRFGQFHTIVGSGLNWIPLFIDNYTLVNVEVVENISASGRMLTSDEKLVDVEMNVQYRIQNPRAYLFSVVNAHESLRQATDSAIRGVVGRNPMETIRTEGRDRVRRDTQAELIETIKPYNMGLEIIDVNFQAARPPEEVKAAFDDAIAARENREQFVREAEAYKNEQVPLANGRAENIIRQANADRERRILEAQGEVSRFQQIMTQYNANPEITRQRLYLETMERVLANSRKILMNDGNSGNNLTVLPLDQLFRSGTSAPVNSTGDNLLNSSSGMNSVPSSANQTNNHSVPLSIHQNGQTTTSSNIPSNEIRNDLSTPMQSRFSNANERLNAIRGGN